MKDKKHRIKSIKVNAILNVTKQLCKVVFPLITMPYVTRVLQASGYGKYNFSSSIVSYFILLAGLGISDYAIREGARIRDNKKKFQIFSEEVFTINILSTIASYMILFVFLLFSKKLLDYRLLIIVQSMSIILNTIGCDWINSVYEDYFYMQQETVQSITECARAGRTQQASWGRLRRWKMQRALARRAILYMMITARRYIPQQGSRQAQAFRLAYR